MGTKIAVVGGGSTYTPELVDGIARRSTRLTADELALFDIDPSRLEVVGGLADRMLRRGGWSGKLNVTTNRDEALEGADFVLIQLRVGGQQARLVDETLPNEFGTIGQETTGPGGFAKALRTVPVLLEIAEQVARRSATDAWIVDFTNPVGIATRALLDDGHRAIGLCNVAIGLQRRFAEKFEVSPDDVQLEHVGLNHLSWERKILVNGVDRLPELVDSDAAGLAEMVGAPAAAVVALRAVPSYYLRYYYSTDEVLREQRDGHHRAQEVMQIEHDLLELYRDPRLDTKPELLDHRGGAFYSEAAAQLIASLHDGQGDIQVVDTYNRGALPDLPDDVVVEVPARITREGAIPLPLAPLAPDMHGLVEAARGYEELTIKAAKSGDRGDALRALAANPLVPDWSTAEQLLDALLAANQAYLPRFFGAQTVNL
ncbi:MAG TPA: 6-phospho-beta-glucosidase [Candidatus Limnocylindrales bacterium]